MVSKVCFVSYILTMVVCYIATKFAFTFFQFTLLPIWVIFIVVPFPKERFLLVQAWTYSAALAGTRD
jgi:hypothetical protein